MSEESLVRLRLAFSAPGLQQAFDKLGDRFRTLTGALKRLLVAFAKANKRHKRRERAKERRWRMQWHRAYCRAYGAPSPAAALVWWHRCRALAAKGYQPKM